MKYSWSKALPYVLALAAAVVMAVLNWTTTIHVSTANGILVMAATRVIGDWLRAQILSEETAHPIPTEGVTATLVAHDLPSSPVTINVHPPSAVTVTAATAPMQLHAADGENINAHNA